jgi:hypothetical protein
MDGRAAGHNFEKIKCEKLTTDDDGRTTYDERNLMVKAHMAYG